MESTNLNYIPNQEPITGLQATQSHRMEAGQAPEQHSSLESQAKFNRHAVYGSTPFPAISNRQRTSDDFCPDRGASMFQRTLSHAESTRHTPASFYHDSDEEHTEVKQAIDPAGPQVVTGSFEEETPQIVGPMTIPQSPHYDSGQNTAGAQTLQPFATVTTNIDSSSLLPDPDQENSNNRIEELELELLKFNEAKKRIEELELELSEFNEAKKRIADLESQLKHSQKRVEELEYTKKSFTNTLNQYREASTRKDQAIVDMQDIILEDETFRLTVVVGTYDTLLKDIYEHIVKNEKNPELANHLQVKLQGNYSAPSKGALL